MSTTIKYTYLKQQTRLYRWNLPPHQPWAIDWGKTVADRVAAIFSSIC